MKKNENAKFYRLTDLGSAAALLSIGFELVKLEPTIGRRVAFIFLVDILDPEIAIKQYWSNKLNVDAENYFSCIKVLKTQIHELTS